VPPAAKNLKPFAGFDSERDAMQSASDLPSRTIGPDNTDNMPIIAGSLWIACNLNGNIMGLPELMDLHIIFVARARRQAGDCRPAVG
jgi:hypothetical protein